MLAHHLLTYWLASSKWAPHPPFPALHMGKDRQKLLATGLGWDGALAILQACSGGVSWGTSPAVQSHDFCFLSEDAKASLTGAKILAALTFSTMNNFQPGL